MPSEAGPFWDQELSFNLTEQCLTFLRCVALSRHFRASSKIDLAAHNSFIIKDDKRLRRDPDVALAPLLLDRAVFDNWCLIPLVDPQGQETKGTLMYRLSKS